MSYNNEPLRDAYVDPGKDTSWNKTHTWNETCSFDGYIVI